MATAGGILAPDDPTGGGPLVRGPPALAHNPCGRRSGGYWPVPRPAN